MSSAVLHFVPREEGMGKALTLALLVHMALVAFLWIGVRWQNEPAVAEAEVWDMQVRDAAPKAAAQPEPVAPPPPAVKAPVAPAQQPVQREVIAKPDIALERERKRKEAEQKAQQQQAKAEEARRQKEAALAEQKKRAQELADKKKRVLAEQKALDAARADEMRRLASSMGSGGSGSAAKSTGNRADASYEQRIKAKIKANTAFAVPPGLNGNPSVEYQVDLLPDGSLRSTPRKLKSSGVPGFDEAVLRAIEKSAPFPSDRYGKVPSSIKITHKPKE